MLDLPLFEQHRIPPSSSAAVESLTYDPDHAHPVQPVPRPNTSPIACLGSFTPYVSPSQRLTVRSSTVRAREMTAALQDSLTRHGQTGSALTAP